MTVRLVAHDFTTTTVNTTATETNLTVLPVPTGGLASDTAIRVTCGGDLLNNTGSPDTFLFTVYLGSTAILTTGATSLAASANRYKWRLQTEIGAATDSTQRATGLLTISAADTDDFSADGLALTGYGTASEDGTDQLDVTLTITLGSSSANLEATHKTGILEAIR
jgi:hypothetical protein